MIINKIKIFLLSFVLFQGIILSQTFTASVDNNKVGINDRFQVTFTFSGTDINGLKNFSPPSFQNFMILSGPNQSSNMEIINSTVSASQSFSYYLQAKATGKFTIGSASISSNGKDYKTNPIAIEVVSGSTKPNNSSNAQGPIISNKDIEDNLFVRAAADKQKVYIGEPVTVTYKLYTRLNIASQMSVNKLPQYNGFWAEELDTPNNITFTTEVLNGKQYRVGILKKVVLFPSQTGELSVTPFELNVPVQIKKRRSSGNIFDDFFNDPFFDAGQTVNYNAKSNTLKIKVIPLPDKNVPPSFSGAVGSFTLNSKIDKRDVKTDEPVSLKINISGTGNIKLINAPEIKLPTGFDKYEPKISEQVNRNGKITGTKSIEYLVIPRIAGKAEIPPVKFSYFDLNKKSYVTLSSEPYTLNVEKGSGSSNYAETSKENVKLLGDDIRFIKMSSDIEKKGGIVIYSVGFWVAAGFPLLLLAGMVTFKKRNDRLLSNARLLKYQKAQKIAKNRLKIAKNLLQEKNQTEFYSEISLALYGYLEDKLNIPKSEFTLDQAITKLKQSNINESVINDLKNTAEKCEYIRFAPQKDGLAAMTEMYDQSANIIIEIEKSISTKKNAHEVKSS
jgi:hypothetical protein